MDADFVDLAVRNERVDRGLRGRAAGDVAPEPGDVWVALDQLGIEDRFHTRRVFLVKPQWRMPMIWWQVRYFVGDSEIVEKCSLMVWMEWAARAVKV